VAKAIEKAFRSFTKGLITEASPLTFPENASLDENNFVLNRDGSRSRRLGIDYENLYQLNSTGLTVDTIKESKQSFHRWTTPGGSSSVSIGIIRIEGKLWFVDLLTANPSANLLNGGSALTVTDLSNAKLQTAVINNKCILVSEDLSKPVLLSYNSTTDTVTQTTIDIKVRDIWGLEDGLDVDERPAALSIEHKYNLRNQGWAENIVTVSTQWDDDNDPATPTVATTDALNATRGALGGYPSNADAFVLGKNSDATDANYEKYDPTILEKNATSRFQVAKGRIIIDAFNRGSSRETNTDVTGLNTDQETGSLTTIAAYAQRLFYSGIVSNVTDPDAKSPNYSGYIFFTQVVTSDDQLGKCHQETDPTDSALNDVVASDGGTVQIPDCSKIIKIVPSQASLLIFAENGVWELYGDTGGFNATSFQLGKISDNGVLNADSIVFVNGAFFYWSNAGIYMLTPDAAGGRFKAVSLSLTTIQSLYLDIPELGKDFCKGYYDEKENRVRWLYNDNNDVVYNTTNYINKYNKELIYDLTLQAWYTNTFADLATGSPYIADYIQIPGYVIAEQDTNVVVNTNTVIDSSSNPVVITIDTPLNRSSQFSYLTIKGTQFTISKFSSLQFKDWYTVDNVGADYSSYLVTGYELYNDIMRRKQANYIFFYLKRTEDGYTEVGGNLELDKQSSCLVQAQWNWANSANSGKWGTQFQAYRLLRNYIPSGPTDTFDYGEEVIVTKNKIRGSGKTLSLKIESEAGKDMVLLGWATPVVTLDRA